MFTKFIGYAGYEVLKRKKRTCAHVVEKEKKALELVF